MLSLRPATPEDAPALAACISAAYAPAAARIPDLPPVDEGIAEDIAAHTVWVICEDGAIVGGLILHIEDAHARLANIAVSPAHRGKGIGRRLIDKAESLTRAAGLAELRLTTHRDMPENVRLYAHLGWHKTGKTGAQIHMRKSLT